MGKGLPGLRTWGKGKRRGVDKVVGSGGVKESELSFSGDEESSSTDVVLNPPTSKQKSDRELNGIGKKRTAATLQKDMSGTLLASNESAHEAAVAIISTTGGSTRRSGSLQIGAKYRHVFYEPSDDSSDSDSGRPPHVAKPNAKESNDGKSYTVKKRRVLSDNSDHSQSPVATPNALKPGSSENDSSEMEEEMTDTESLVPVRPTLTAKHEADKSNNVNYVGVKTGNFRVSSDDSDDSESESQDHYYCYDPANADDFSEKSEGPRKIARPLKGTSKEQVNSMCKIALVHIDEVKQSDKAKEPVPGSSKVRQQDSDDVEKQMEMIIAENADEYVKFQNANEDNKAYIPFCCPTKDKLMKCLDPEKMKHQEVKYPGVKVSTAKVGPTSSTGFVSVSPKTVIPFEIAEEQCLMVVVKGEISVKTTGGYQFNETTGENVLLCKTLSPGYMFIIPKKCQYTIENWTNSEALLGYCKRV